MNLLVVGASHRTAPVEVLERLALTADRAAELATGLVAGRYVGEAVVLSTCNRVEVYAAVSGFHGGLTEIAGRLAAHGGMAVDDLSGHLYVRHEAQAVRHAFTVAAGLDSMVAGEAQILGQLRDAYESARESGHAGRLLHELLQQALRVGKRVQSEAQVGAAAPSVVTAALAVGVEHTGRELAGADALVVGAGAMGALSLAALRRAGAGRCYVVNRDFDRAVRLAANHDAEAVAWDALATVVPHVDVIVSATGAPAPVIDETTLADRRGGLLVCDLAVPRDVAASVAALPGVHVVDIGGLGDSDRPGPGARYLEAAERILVEEIDAFLGVARAAQVAPTVAALRSRADEVVDGELARLRRRRPDLSDEQRAEIAHTVHRVVRQLLHQPTVRVRQLASEPGGESYAAALRELFALEAPDLSAVEPDVTAEALRVTPETVDPRQ
ncbi:glutamyl-tRNA reductase [Stackebrandtia albiflava]|uniref:Glutamyl-tRNA reductase n=1 Tax=Stackebrandtia albiflava TaxID=406432 RepID=A0A562UYP2_9ACTN|nr:glutamyl-tRNA reductase [Stackebrandtia albiflava]TWJ10717.1 glutamyl-tRNA reductase [Stackebrandtia albiflava]